MSEGHRTMSRIRDADTLLQILDQLPTSIFVKNEKLEFEYSNAAHCNLIGVPADELIGHTDHDFYPNREAEGFQQRDQAVLLTGQTAEAEEFVTSRAGVTAPVLTRKSRLAAADGHTYLIGTNTNLSDIRKREEQYRALAQTVPVGIWQVEESGETSFANPLLLAYLGIGSEAIDSARDYRQARCAPYGLPGQGLPLRNRPRVEVGRDPPRSDHQLRLACAVQRRSPFRTGERGRHLGNDGAEARQ